MILSLRDSRLASKNIIPVALSISCRVKPSKSISRKHAARCSNISKASRPTGSILMSFALASPTITDRETRVLPSNVRPVRLFARRHDLYGAHAVGPFCQMAAKRDGEQSGGDCGSKRALGRDRTASRDVLTSSISLHGKGERWSD